MEPTDPSVIEQEIPERTKEEVLEAMIQRFEREYAQLVTAYLRAKKELADLKRRVN
jgi:molecular chaperone GrpE (heat shock protein)